MRRKVFSDWEYRNDRPLKQYYLQNLPYITGEEVSKPEDSDIKTVKQLDDIWGSSSDEEDTMVDSERFGIDERFILDKRFTEHEEHNYHLHQMKMDADRQKRMEEKAKSKRTVEDLDEIEEEEDVTTQIRKERSNALDILAEMDLHNPMDTLTEEERHQAALSDGDQEGPDDNEVLWGKSIARYDPTMESSDEEENEEKEEEEEETKSDIEVDNNSEKNSDTVKNNTVKQVKVDASWAKDLVSGGSWSLFGNSASESTIESTTDRDNDIIMGDDSDEESEDSDSMEILPLEVTSSDVVSLMIEKYLFIYIYHLKFEYFRQWVLLQFTGQ